MSAAAPPLGFALVALLLTGAYELLYRKAHALPLYEPGFMVVQTGSVFLTLGLLSAGGIGWTLTVRTALLGIGSGLLGYLTGWSYLYAMGRGPVAVTSAGRRLSFVVTAVLAMMILGERLTLVGGFAMGLAVLAFVVMASDADERGRPHPMLLLTIVSAGCMAFCHKLAAVAGVSASAFLMCQSGTAHVASHAVCFRTGGYRITGRVARFATITGSLIALMMVASVYALRGADAVIIAPVLQLGFLVTAPGSFLLFREPVTVRKIVGLVAGAASIVLFGFGIG